MARWKLGEMAGSIWDIIKLDDQFTPVCVEAGPVVDATTGRTFLWARAGPAGDILADVQYESVHMMFRDGIIGKWIAIIRIGERNVKGDIYMCEPTRYLLLRSLEKFVAVVEAGLVIMESAGSTLERQGEQKGSHHGSK